MSYPRSKEKLVGPLSVVNALVEICPQQRRQVLVRAHDANVNRFANSTVLVEQAVSRGEDVCRTIEESTAKVVAT